MGNQNNTGTFYVVEVYFSLMSKNNHTPILVNEIQDIVADKDRAILLARDCAENNFTPAFVTDAVNDVVVREARMVDGKMKTDDSDIWSAAAERILAWQKPENLK